MTQTDLKELEELYKHFAVHDIPALPHKTGPMNDEVLEQALERLRNLKMRETINDRN